MRIKLKELMGARGWSAAQVVRTTGLNVGTIYRLREQSVARIDEQSLVAIARAFETTDLNELVEVDWDQPSQRQVVNLDTGTIYPSVAAAAREMFCTSSAIHAAINKKKRCCDYRWNYLNQVED